MGYQISLMTEIVTRQVIPCDDGMLLRLKTTTTTHPIFLTASSLGYALSKESSFFSLRLTPSSPIRYSLQTIVIQDIVSLIGTDPGRDIFNCNQTRSLNSSTLLFYCSSHLPKRNYGELRSV